MYPGVRGPRNTHPEAVSGVWTFAVTSGVGIPLLGQGGVDATSTKISRSLLCWSGRGGWFNYRLFGGLIEPPRLRRSNEASRFLIGGAATPPWPRRGIPTPDVTT